jgi:hypothetical protein
MEGSSECSFVFDFPFLRLFILATGMWTVYAESLSSVLSLEPGFFVQEVRSFPGAGSPGSCSTARRFRMAQRADRLSIGTAIAWRCKRPPEGRYNLPMKPRMVVRVILVVAVIAIAVWRLGLIPRH